MTGLSAAELQLCIPLKCEVCTWTVGDNQLPEAIPEFGSLWIWESMF